MLMSWKRWQSQSTHLQINYIYMVLPNSAFKKEPLCVLLPDQYEIISINGHHERSLLAGCTSCWQDVTSYDIIVGDNVRYLPLCWHLGGFHRCVRVRVPVDVLYLLLGWVEVLRSGLKEQSDLLTLGDVNWQLNEGLQAQTLVNAHTLTRKIPSLRT